MRKDAVTPGDRDEVLRRDRFCFLFRLDDSHECRDTWGTPHSPFDRSKLTLDHVKQRLMLGRRAPSDPAHMVAMCGAGNVRVPSKDVRAAQREYLATLYPEAWGRAA